MCTRWESKRCLLKKKSATPNLNDVLSGLVLPAKNAARQHIIKIGISCFLNDVSSGLIFWAFLARQDIIMFWAKKQNHRDFFSRERLWQKVA